MIVILNKLGWSILTWTRGLNHDHEGGSSRARLLHCTKEWLTPAISPNVGNSTSSFLLVGICVRANPFHLNFPFKPTTELGKSRSNFYIRKSWQMAPPLESLFSVPLQLCTWAAKSSGLWSFRFETIFVDPYLFWRFPSWAEKMHITGRLIWTQWGCLLVGRRPFFSSVPFP